MPPSPDAALSLAAAETAFAAHCVRENMRPAFLANFADDGVFVRDGWTLGNAFLATRPDPPIVLDWRPAHVEVAASGELGLSTGPTRLTPAPRPDATPRFGQYVSVWRRVGGGPWKVAVDLGINHPEPALAQAPLEARVVTDAGVAGGLADLEGAEEAFSRTSQAAGQHAAHAAFGSERLRWYREGTSPWIGKAAALSAPQMNDERLAWFVERAEAARSGDFGYVRGHYRAAGGGGAPAGHYLRVWRRERGAWRVAIDITNPATPR